MPERNAEFHVLIESNRVQKEYIKDLVQYRELFYFFAWRDILVRYKQAFFGIAWAIVRPLLNMLIFAFLFGKIAHLPSDNVNYFLFVLAGMLPWQLYSNSIVDACNSLVVNSQLVSKVYFPRMIIPTGHIIVHLLDFFIVALLLFLIILVTGTISMQTVFFLPFFIVLNCMLSIGVGLWLSALTVQYRDFRILVPFFVQFGMFLSPVGYGSSIIPSDWQMLYSLNPMVGIIDGFRWALFGISQPYFLFSLSSSILITGGVLFSGFFYFRKMERTFADTI